MDWQSIQQKIRTLAQRIRNDKIVDSVTAELLAAIPLVGGFLSKYWEKTAGDTESAISMAAFMDAISAQQESFSKLVALVTANGDMLIEQNYSLGQILVSIDETRDNVKDIKTQINRFVETLKIPSAKAAFEIAAAMNEDFQQSSPQLEHAEKVLQMSGDAGDAHSYYQLGMVYLSMSNFSHAEACLLKAVDLRSDLADAMLGIAMIYQRRATEHLRQENFGLAEEAAKKSEGYVKSAMLHDPTDFGIQVHLGYFYKDLAQRFNSTGNKVRANEAFIKAVKCFDNALKVDPDNASAHNGLGSLSIILGEYGEAIHHCNKAIAINPDYLFAHFDLTQCYYAIAVASQDEKSRFHAIENACQAYLKVIDLDGATGGDKLPVHARNAIDGMFKQLKAMLPQ
jgi:tetratricopeptide (TPR) repeat protein